MRKTKLMLLTVFVLTAFSTMSFSACSDEGDKEETKTKSVMEAVDLGLPSGTKWASCNVGASAPEDYGSYFSWGGTSPYDGSCQISNLSISEMVSKGIIDSDRNLTASYDAATVICGKGWKMPTLAQVEELVSLCDWHWTNRNGVYGCWVSYHGAGIFLPAAGDKVDKINVWDAGLYGEYWIATKTEGVSAYQFKFHQAKDSFGGLVGTGDSDISAGLTIRPVAE